MSEYDQNRYDVVIATYNGEKFLSTQIDSILHQSEPPRAIYIRDDGSTDGTVAVIESYVAKYTNVIQVAGNKRLGYIKNFEELVRHCTSAIVFFSDQDDIWEPQKAADILAAFQGSERPVCVYSNAQIVDEVLVPTSALIDIEVKSTASLDDLLKSCMVTGATMACERQFLHEVCLPFAPDIPHDYWIAFHAARLDRLKYLPAMLTLYRQHGANQIGARGPSVVRRALRALTVGGFRRRWRVQYYRHKLLQELSPAELSARENLDGFSLLDVVYGTGDGAISLSGVAHVTRTFGLYSLLFAIDWILARKAWIAQKDQ